MSALWYVDMEGNFYNLNKYRNIRRQGKDILAWTETSDIHTIAKCRDEEEAKEFMDALTMILNNKGNEDYPWYLGKVIGNYRVIMGKSKEAK